MREINNYKKVYKEFWQDIVEKDGELDKDAIMRELSDYHHVLQNVPKVYCAVTGNRMSKTTYYADDVISEFEKLNMDRGMVWDDIQALTNDCTTLEELRSEVIGYFSFKD